MMYEVKCYECNFTTITEKFELAVQAQNYHRHVFGHSDVGINRARRFKVRNKVVIGILIPVLLGVLAILVTVGYRDNPALLLYWCETGTDNNLHFFVENEYFGPATDIYVSLHSSAQITITDSNATASDGWIDVEKLNAKEYFITFLGRADYVKFDVETTPSLNDLDCASHVYIKGASAESVIFQRDDIPQTIQNRKKFFEAIQCFIHPLVGDTKESSPCIMPVP